MEKIKKMNISQMQNASNADSTLGAELREELLAAQELENVEGGDWCDYGCMVGCLSNGWISL